MTDQLIEVLPVILRHQPERTQHRPAEVVKVGVAIIRIAACLNADITVRAGVRIVSRQATQTSPDLSARLLRQKISIGSALVRLRHNVVPC